MIIHLAQKTCDEIDRYRSIVPQDADEPAISGGAFADVKDMMSPFGFMRCEV